MLVEDASRFAGSLLSRRPTSSRSSDGCSRAKASGDDLTASENPFKVAMRQIAGVFAQPEGSASGQAEGARDRKRATAAKVEGRKSYAEIDAKQHIGQMLMPA